jgi:hypothetical protein
MSGAATMSFRQYALARGVSNSTITQAVREGRLPVEADGRIDPEHADATWYRRYQQRQASTDVAARRAAAELQHTQARLSLAEHALARMEARLVERTQVEVDLRAVADGVLTAVAGLPQDTGPDSGLLQGEGVLLQKLAALVRADLGDLHHEVDRFLGQLDAATTKD